jgi:hypothetical protein
VIEKQRRRNMRKEQRNLSAGMNQSNEKQEQDENINEFQEVLSEEERVKGGEKGKEELSNNLKHKSIIHISVYLLLITRQAVKNFSSMLLIQGCR